MRNMILAILMALSFTTVALAAGPSMPPPEQVQSGWVNG
jgi:hypothetical protein